MDIYFFPLFWAKKDKQYKSGAAGSGDLPYKGGQWGGSTLVYPHKSVQGGESHPRVNLPPTGLFAKWVGVEQSPLPFCGDKVTFYGSTISLHGKLINL